jgi:hypothetical protein
MSSEVWSQTEQQKQDMRALGYYHISDIALCVTHQDIVGHCLTNRNSVIEEGSPEEWTEEKVLDHIRSFEKAMEWSVMDPIWDCVDEVAWDIESQEQEK